VNSRESGELVTGEARQSGSTLPKLQSISFSGPATVIRDVLGVCVSLVFIKQRRVGRRALLLNGDVSEGKRSLFYININ
jgi:hypothetical protein